MKTADLVVLVRCLHCHHRSTLDPQTLAAFGIKPDAPIAAFVKRLRCTKCGSGSVMATRVANYEAAARRLRACGTLCPSLAAFRRPGPSRRRPACFIVNDASGQALAYCRWSMDFPLYTLDKRREAICSFHAMGHL